MSPFFGIPLAILLLFSLLGLSRFWQLKANLHPELARKIMHIGMGMIALSFPWLLQEAWAVIFICILTIIVLLALKHFHMLRQQIGGVLHDVKRHSYGDIYFLLSIAGLFLLAQSYWLLYLIPLLVLTFADALAALTGVIYGKRTYTAADGLKTIEGSLVFLVITFLATYLPLWLFAGHGGLESILIAVLVALLTMLVEAVSWEGLDNLLIPLVTFVALDGHRLAPLELLWKHLAIIAALTSITFMVRRRMPLTAGALATAALVLYLCTTIGGILWLIAPLICAVSAALVYFLHQKNIEQTHSEGYGVRLVAALAAPSLIWLLTFRYLHRHEDLYLFTLVWAAQLAGLVTFNRQEDTENAIMHPVSIQTLLFAALLGSFTQLIPWAILAGGQWIDWIRALLGFFIIGIVLFGCGILAQRKQLNFQRQVTVLGLAGLLGFWLLSI